MNRFLSILAVGLLTIVLYPASSSAHHGGSHHTGGYKSSIHKVGKIHTHKSHKKNWGGFSKKRWSSRCRCSVYWSPSDCCWYRYCASSDDLEPIDDMTDENCDE